jgi:hypothetical protein
MKQFSYIFFFIFSLCLLGFGHGFHTGYSTLSNYSLEKQKIHFKFVIEAKLLKAMGKGLSCEPSQKTALCVVQVLKTETQLIIQGKEVVFEFESSQIKEGMYTLELLSSEEFKGLSIDSLKVINQLFKGQHEKVKNRIEFDLFGIQKSYLLSQKVFSVSVIP